MKYYIGIDDSGRGPVIGPMVLAGVLADEKQAQMLRELGAKDSKLLTAGKRELLAKRLKKFIAAFYVVKISAKEIDEKLNSGTNLNKVEAIKAAEIINLLMKRVKELNIIDIEIVVDCPSPNKISWKNYLLKLLIDKEVNLRCEHKADRDHVVVSAASILAKVERDSQVEKIKTKFGIECGSGYPSDPICKKLLEERGKELSELGIVRKTWATWKNHVTKKSQKKIADF